MTDSKSKQLEADVEEYDEIHAFFPELGEKHFRESDTEFNHEAGLATVDNGVTFRRYDVSEIVYWTPPRDF